MKPGYKQTEVGVIPEDWGVHSLGDLNPYVTSGSRGWAEFYADHGNLFVRITNMSRESIYLDLADSKFVCIPPDSSEGVRTQLQENDVLISITADIGIVSYVDAAVPSPAYINQHIALVRFSPGQANGKFVSYFLAANAAQRNFRAKTDSGAKAGMSLGGISKIQTALPPRPEQSAIATALSDVDALLTGLNKLIAKKRDLKQAAMQQLLTGKTRLPGFAGEWEVKRLGEIFSITVGTSKSAYIEDGGNFWIVDMGSVTMGGKLSVSKATNFSGDFLQAGDLVMPKDDIGGGKIIGRVAYLDGDATYVLGDHVYRLKAKLGDSLFLSYAINSHHINSDLRKKAAGSAQLGLGRKSVEEQEIELPPIEEQAAIAEVLSDMDTELAALEQRREKTRLFKQGMMQELLTGKTRLVVSEVTSLAATAQVIDFPSISKKPGGKPIQQESTAGGKKANVHFIRSVLAAGIIDRLHDEPTFGHVKCEKVIYLADRLCKVDTGSHYHRDAAGPYDNRALRSIDSQLKRQQWFDAQKVDGRFRYVPMAKRGGHKQYFDRYFSEAQSAFDRIIDTFRSMRTEQCEIVATLFEAWHDLLERQQPVSDDAIVHEVLNNWHDSKRRISEDRWRKALDWMRGKGFVPEGAESA